MGTFHSTKNHRQLKGGKCYGYILQSFLKIRKLLNSEKRTISLKIPGGKLEWSRHSRWLFFRKFWGKPCRVVLFARNSGKLRSIQHRKFPEMARVLGWMESAQCISLLAHFFMEKVHYPGKDTKHSWQGWKSQTSTFAISSNCSKILEIPKNFASSRTPFIQNIQPKMILKHF